jgi:hypothetical protein
MQTLPTVVHSLRRSAFALLALAALSGLGAVACGNDLPPGARPIGAEDEGGGTPAPTAAPSAVPGPQVPSPNAPRVVALDPPDGATGIDPSRTTLSVTFDRPMDPQGWAWVIEDAATAPDIGEAHFDASGLTNTVDVTLEPNRDYVVWINSQTYTYFKGVDGTPAVPYRWTFSTAGGAGEGDLPLISSRDRDGS